MKIKGDKMKFFIASKNKHKIAEFTRILKPLGIELLSESDLERSLSEVDETGATFEENAYLKAISAVNETGLPSIADDSGLCVDALDGAPGIYSARFAGEPADNQRNNEKLLDLLKNIPQKERTAKFVCCIVCVFPSGEKVTVRGECPGYIAENYSGNRGFGYDPLFVSEIGCFGDLTDEQKDSVSHRGRALREFSNKIKEYINGETYA